MAKSPIFTLKLLIDEKKNKVVLAEADQDFVDVLISLLSLPMGTIARRLENHKTVLGCYKNLTKSVDDMSIDHFETEAWKSMLLFPRSTKGIHCKRLKLNMGYTTNATFYMCSNFFTNASCTNAYSNFCTSRCSCGDYMSSQIAIPEEDQVEEVINNADGVFVNCRSSFIVTDDLNVTENSIGVIMKTLNDLGYLGFSDLQETLLDVGFEEVLTLLGCLFTSEAPLTDAFLRKHCMPKMHKMLSPLVPTPRHVVPSGVFTTVKVFVRKVDREILYTECNEDFVDSLLTFLVTPLELACSLSNGNTILGCVGKLSRSQCRRASASNFLRLPDYYYTCRNNNLLGSFSHVSPTYECLVPPPRDINKSWCYRFARQIRKSLLSDGGKIVSVCRFNLEERSGFMKKNTKFIVSNDLVITPINSSSIIGLLKKMHLDISDLEEHQISISKAELISILRASLISSSALTEGLSNFLLKKPKEET